MCRQGLLGEALRNVDPMGLGTVVAVVMEILAYVCFHFLGDEGFHAWQPEAGKPFVTDMLGFFEQAYDYVLIPDTRFRNEIEYLIESGFDVTHMRIIRDNYVSDMPEEQQNHISETALDDCIPDIYVHNSGYLAEFYDNLLMAMDELRL